MKNRTKKMKLDLNKQAKMRLLVGLALCQAFTVSDFAYAQWDGLETQYGQATYQYDGNHLDVNVHTNQLIVNAQSLDIASHESVNIQQLAAQNSALFRSLGTSGTKIFGSLTSNGRVFLINQNGILFGQSAQVDVGGLVASNMHISNADFLSGKYQFNADGSTNGVANQGIIKVSDGGYLVLLGKHVNNSGTLLANNGSVVLASADSAVLDFYGNGLVKANLSGDALSAVVSQSGVVQADGGSVQLATNSRSSAVNVSGITQANTLVERNGVIRLEGGDNAKVAVTGTLKTAGEQPGTSGGEITVTGEQVALLGDATLDASGEAGGGTVLVGGDYQGNNNAVYNARTTYAGQNTSINVDAKQTGDAGKAIVWADHTTRFYGDVSAKGGALSGDGGFVEVSGKQNLDFVGSVDVSAPKGTGGKVLFDPENIILNNSTQPAPTNNVDGTPDVAFADAPIVGTTTIQVNDVRGFSELYLQATNDITVANTLSMLTNNSVVLEANNDINVNAEISTRGTGGITLNADNDVNLNGRLNSYGTGDIAVTADADNSGAGDITVNQRIYSRGDINLSGFNVQGATTAGYVQAQALVGQPKGDITINATNDINLAGALNTYARNGAAAANGEHAGDVSLTAGGAITTGNISAYGGRGGAGNTNAGNAGNITINSTGVGDISIGNVNARNGRASGSGLGGAIGTVSINNASGNIDTKNLAVYGDTNGNGGNIDIDAAAGDITVTGYAYVHGAATAAGSTATGGNGGNIDLNASGDVTVTSRIYAQGAAANAANTAAGGNGGNINVTGSNLTFGNVIYSSGNIGRGANQAGGNAGNINLNAAGTIAASNTISANGGSGAAGAGSNANAGNAGTVNILSTGAGDITTGTVNARNGAGRGTGNGGAVGTININNAVGNINTKTLNVSGNLSGHGGNIDVDASAGDITVTGVAYAQGGTTAAGSTANGGDGGTINLDASGDVTVTNRVYAYGGGVGSGNTAEGGNGGAINVNGANLNLNNVVYAYGANARGLNQAGGDAGAINLNGTGTITTNNVYAYGGSGGTGAGSNADGGDAGNITIASTGAGDVTTRVVNARNGAARGTGVGGATGSININNANGDIATRNLDTYGNLNGDGGDITVAAAIGDVSVTGRVYAYGGTVNNGHTLAGRNGGNINISGVNRTVTSRVNANGNTAKGASQAGGNAGTVAITGTGTLNVADVYSRNGRATDDGAGGNVGSITLTGSTVTASSTVSTSGERNGDAGNINITSSSGATNVKNVYASGGAANTNTAGNNAGNITINSAGALVTTNVYANGSTGNGLNQAGGNAGAVDVDAASSITMNALNATGGTAGSGVGSNANGGNAGSINVRSTAAGDISINNNLSMHSGFARGTGNGGAAGSIVVKNDAGNITTQNIYAEGYNHGNGSNVTLDAENVGNVTVNGQIRAYGDVSASSSRAGTDGGDVTIKGINNTIASTINTNGGRGTGANQIGGDAGNVTIDATGAISTQVLAANGGNAGSGAGSNAAGGDAGNISLASTGAGDITTTTISARTGYTRGTATATGAGSVNIQNDDGALTTGNITTRGQRRGVGGDIIAVTTGGDIAVGTVDARASNLAATDGGDVTLATTTGDVTVTNILTGGRWLVYSGDPRNDTVGAFKSTADFKQYNTNYGDALLDGGDGFVYRFAPIITTSLTGTATKPYDGNTVASIAGLTLNQVGGEIDGDVINISGLTSATYNNKNVGTGKKVTSNPLTVINGSNGTSTVYGYQVAAAKGNVGVITESALSQAEAQTAAAAASNPRNAAGLDGLLYTNEQPQQFLAVFDVGATASGGDIDAEEEVCLTNQEKKAQNPNTSLMLNFGVNLPEGVDQTCI